MPKSFFTLHMQAAEQAAGAPPEPGRPGPFGMAPDEATRGARAAAPAPEDPAFANDEAAARFYLSRMLERQEHPGIRGLAAPSRPEVVPDLRMVDVSRTPGRERARAATRVEGRRSPFGMRESEPAAPPERGPRTTLVRFEQTRSSIPVFGSRATVELDADRRLVSIYASVAEVASVSPVAELGPAEAIRRVAESAGVAPETLGEVEPPTLTFYNDEESGVWHLAYFVRDVAAVPAYRAGHEHGRGHGLGRSPRELSPRFHYLVDAHEGNVLLGYPAHPMVTLCRGADEEGVVQRFYARLNDGGAYEMFDPLRSIRTFDLGGGDIQGEFPAAAITSPVSEPWDGPAAVSAHVNAQRVQQFLSDVLGRHGIDDKGMELVSVVNCTYARHQRPPEWSNAVWWNGRMWYGQTNEGGRMRSYSRHLDIIAHELAHGLTQYTANLVYRKQSGALNESVSDIFGVIIHNWYTRGADSDAGGWTWELGKGLGDDGRPLRDLANPRSTGDPDHMSQYQDLPLSEDEGGVHVNSNIHNKAAYNLLTATEPGGARTVAARDVAVLYYLALQRLGGTAGFGDMRRALVETAKSYIGQPAERARVTQAIEKAYDDVGIA